MTIALVIVAIISILYGVLIMSLGSGTYFFLFWYGLGAFLLIAAWVIQSGIGEALPLIAKRIASVTAALLAAGFFVSLGFIASEFNAQGEDDLDYLIVLGAQVRDGGPSIILQNRLDAAYDYLVRNDGATCIVSGGQGRNEPMTEADAMADYLIGRGIDPNRIIREDQAENTRENISYSLAFLDSKSNSVGIVTNNFHVFRGVRIAHKNGLINACGISAPSLPLFLPNNLVRESMSVAKDFVTGEL